MTISGQLIPAQSTNISLYYRVPRETGPWKLATTIGTNPSGVYSITTPIPYSLLPGSYDLIAVWFKEDTVGYAIIPIQVLTIT